MAKTTFLYNLAGERLQFAGYLLGVLSRDKQGRVLIRAEGLHTPDGAHITVSNAMRKNPVYLQNPADPPRTGVNLIKNTGIIFLDNDEIRRIYMAGKV